MESSITALIGQLKAGDSKAIHALFESYFDRLVRLARTRLGGAPRAVEDEEDIALSAFDSFCRRATNGQFPRLDDRNDLWQILLVITIRKAVDHIRRQSRQKRDGHRIISLEDIVALSGDELSALEPSPELALLVTDEFRALMSRLDDATLRQIALWRMEGYTNREIASRLGCIEATVERKLQRIRRNWLRENPHASHKSAF